MNTRTSPLLAYAIIFFLALAAAKANFANASEAHSLQFVDTASDPYKGAMLKDIKAIFYLTNSSWAKPEYNFQSIVIDDIVENSINAHFETTSGIVIANLFSAADYDNFLKNDCLYVVITFQAVEGSSGKAAIAYSIKPYRYINGNKGLVTNDPLRTKDLVEVFLIDENEEITKKNLEASLSKYFSKLYHDYVTVNHSK